MGQSASSDEDLADVRQASGPAWDMRTDPEWQNRVNRLSGSQSNTSRSVQTSTLLDNVSPRVSEYDPSSPSGVSYQNSEPSYGSRPGTEPGLPAPHQAGPGGFGVPQVTVTSPGKNARLELVD